MHDQNLQVPIIIPKGSYTSKVVDYNAPFPIHYGHRMSYFSEKILSLLTHDWRSNLNTCPKFYNA